MSDTTPQHPSDVPPAPPVPPTPPTGYAPPPSPVGAPGYAQQNAYPYPPQPPYGYGAPGSAPAVKTNTLAITSLVSAIAAFVILPFIASIVAVITGHIALKQLRTSGEAGRGLALAGTIVGWVGIAFGLLVIAIILFTLIIAATSAGLGSYSYS